MKEIILVTSKYSSAGNICIFLFYFVFNFLIKQYLNSKFQTELFFNCKAILIKADID